MSDTPRQPRRPGERPSITQPGTRPVTRADTPPPSSGSGPRPTVIRIPANSGIVIGVVIAGLLVGLAIVFFVLPRWLTSSDSTPAATSAEAPAAAADARRSVTTLYYVADNGEQLTAVSHEVAFASTPAELARNILAAQLAAAPSGSVSAIPAGVTLRGLFLTPRGDAYVDLSREIITGHPGGSMNEALTVYTVVSALTQNVKEITSVQILVDGKQVDTLAGHIDLRQPLTADARWIQKGQ